MKRAALIFSILSIVSISLFGQQSIENIDLQDPQFLEYSRSHDDRLISIRDGEFIQLDSIEYFAIDATGETIFQGVYRYENVNGLIQRGDYYENEDGVFVRNQYIILEYNENDQETLVSTYVILINGVEYLATQNTFEYDSEGNQSIRQFAAFNSSGLQTSGFRFEYQYDGEILRTYTRSDYNVNTENYDLARRYTFEFTDPDDINPFRRGDEIYDIFNDTYSPISEVIFNYEEDLLLERWYNEYNDPLQTYDPVNYRQYTHDANGYFSSITLSAWFSNSMEYMAVEVDRFTNDNCGNLLTRKDNMIIDGEEVDGPSRIYYYSQFVNTADVVLEEVIVYPNPISQSFQVSEIDQETHYTIYDMDGRLVQSGPISNGEPIGVHQLSNGSYILEIPSYKRKQIIIHRD